jgi:antitoxin HigA-1
MTKPRVPHPGRVLLQEWLDPCGISQNELARHMQMSPRRVNEIVLGKRGITAGTALRLGWMFALDPRYWMRLQMEYELDQASLPAEQRARKLPAQRRSRAARRYDAFRFLMDD